MGVTWVAGQLFNHVAFKNAQREWSHTFYDTREGGSETMNQQQKVKGFPEAIETAFSQTVVQTVRSP
jgi:hypothetical protein